MLPSCALLGGYAIGARLPCYGNITRTRNVSEYMLVLDLCLVYRLLPAQTNRHANTSGPPVRWSVIGLISDLNYETYNV